MTATANPPAANNVRARLAPLELFLMTSLSLALVAGREFGWFSLSRAEVWGFITGGICVWLVVRENIWNWPIGLANNVFFFLLFHETRLFADMWLQLVYFFLGIYGWINWLAGGEKRTQLKVTRTTKLEWIGLSFFILAGTPFIQRALIYFNGSAPFWDALTTILSLAAQYLLCRKRYENWFFWITADLIYIPLYWSRQLPLTAILYFVFLCLCLAGLKQWKRQPPSTV